MSHGPFDQFVLHHLLRETLSFSRKAASKSPRVMQHKRASA